MNRKNGRMELNGRKVVVAGLGRSGQAAARWVAAKGGRVICSDRQPLSLWQPDLLGWCEAHGAVVEAGEHRLETFLCADLVVVSPGLPGDLLVLCRAREAGVPIIGELALAAAAWKGPLLAITGTNGKSTTTELVGTMLGSAGIPCVVAGNIGTPLTTCLLQGHADKTAVLEVSSFQLDDCPMLAGNGSYPPFAPHVAAWLNLAPDHLDRYPDLAAYGASKARILAAQGPSDWAVLNLDDAGMRPWLSEGQGRRFFFGVGRREMPGAWLDLRRDRIAVSWPDGREEEFDLRAWSPPGVHSRENLLAAVLMARLSGVEPEVVQDVVSRFRALEHRLQWVARTNGVDYYDDSKATNVAAVIRGVEALGRPVVLIAGGLGKGEDYATLAGALEGVARAAILLGEERRALAAALRGRTTVIIVPEDTPQGLEAQSLSGGRDASGAEVMRLAVEAAAGLAESGDVVLLAPACASFDLFESYRARGLAFQGAVRQLEGGGRMVQ